MARMVGWPASIFRRYWGLIKELQIAVPQDLVADTDVSSIRLNLKSGDSLRAGRYFLSAVVPRQTTASRNILDVEVRLPERSLSFQIDLRDGRPLMPVVLMQDATCLLLSLKSDTGALPVTKWRIRKMGYATFYGCLTLRFLWRLLWGSEDRQMLMDAITRHGLDGFGSAVRGDWDAALTLPHSVFTRRTHNYPDATSLPKDKMVGVSGGKLVGDLSFATPTHELDAAVLRNARLAGLSALCLRFEWGDGCLGFSEQTRRFLENPALDFPFLFRLEPIAPSQTLPGASNERACSEAMSSIFDDPRYLRIEGRPVLLASSACALSAPAVARARSLGAASGCLPFFVLAVPTGYEPPASIKRDGLASLIDMKRDAARMVITHEESVGLPDIPPARFGRLLFDVLRESSKESSEHRRFTVVEFAGTDGAGPRLVEDSRYGYAWIENLRVAQSRHAASLTSVTTSPRIAVVIHAFYPELLTEILDGFRPGRFHALFVTTVTEREEEVRHILDKADVDYVLRIFENRGRDVLPFIKVYDELVSGGFDLVIKVHTKRSIHRADGDAWRQSLIKPILHASDFKRIVAAFEKDAALGMIGPAAHLTGMQNNIVVNENRVFGLGRRLGLTGAEVRRSKFFAGSMFIVRVSALAAMMNLALDDEDFEQEAGQLDGTMAHALERVFALSVVACGMEVKGIGAMTPWHSLRERCRQFLLN